MKTFITICLLLLSGIALYYSMFWGWASGTGPVDQPRLKFASNVALAVSFGSFWAAAGLWLVPLLAKKRKNTSSKSTNHAT